MNWEINQIFWPKKKGWKKEEIYNKSVIDLIFTNRSVNEIFHGTLPKIADHEGVLVSLNTISHRIKPNTRIIYDYKNSEEAGLSNL